MNVRRLLVGSMAALSLAAVPAAAPATTAKRASPVITCTRAIIGGQSKCIARGQYCARAHARDYQRHGLSCTKRDARGRYHLR
jgi:hypothetical protein